MASCKTAGLKNNQTWYLDTAVTSQVVTISYGAPAGQPEVQLSVICNATGRWEDDPKLMYTGEINPVSLMMTAQCIDAGSCVARRVGLPC